METNETYYTDLIAKYLAGECEPGEIHELEAWVASDPACEKHFRATAGAWRLVNAGPLITPDAMERDWNALRAKLNLKADGNDVTGTVRMDPSASGRSAGRRKVIFTLPMVLRVAAVILLFMAPVFLLYRYLLSDHAITVAAYDAPKETTLPDGTVITLNTGSHIVYSSGFSGPLRRVTLSGEAFFEVARDRSRPFIVSSGDFSVRVAGTTFFIDTETNHKTAEVILESGCVRVYGTGQPGQPVTILPGERAELAPDGRQITKSRITGRNYLAWKTLHIEFDNTPLSEVTGILKQVYRKEITISGPHLASCPITVTFDHQTLDEVLQVISATLGLRVSQTGSAIVLSGEVCR